MAEQQAIRALNRLLNLARNNSELRHLIYDIEMGIEDLNTRTIEYITDVIEQLLGNDDEQ